MKNGFIIKSCILFGVLFGGLFMNSSFSWAAEADAVKEKNEIVAKAGKDSVTLTVDSNDIKVQQMKNPNGRKVQVLLIKGKFKNTGERTTTPLADFDAKQKNEKGDSITLSSYSYEKQLSKKNKQLHSNLNKEIKPNTSVQGLWLLKLEGDGDVTINSIFDGKGSMKIKVKELID